jgi:hypothetical protein
MEELRVTQELASRINMQQEASFQIMKNRSILFNLNMK